MTTCGHVYKQDMGHKFTCELDQGHEKSLEMKDRLHKESSANGNGGAVYWTDAMGKYPDKKEAA